MSCSDNSMPGGQPSTTTPIERPWLSPHVVIRKTLPKELPDIALMIAMIEGKQHGGLGIDPFPAAPAGQPVKRTD
jgi:hypothetical protein